MSSASNLPKILITGSNGQVGFELSRSLSAIANVIELTRAELDLAQTDQIEQILNEHMPDIIINPAAYTAVDRAESESDLANAINGEAPRVMAQWATSNDVLLVHFSTDYVFDGSVARPYVEDDMTNPQSVYGSSKALGEENVRHHARHIILRTSWVYGAHGNNFLKTMLNLMKTRDSLSVVYDQFGTPTCSTLIADVTAHIVRDYWGYNHKSTYPNYGTYHLTANGQTSWFAYAQYIANYANEQGFNLKMGSEDIKGILATEYPTPATRPENSTLDCSKLQDTFNLDLPLWQEGVRYTMTLLKAVYEQR